MSLRDVLSASRLGMRAPRARNALQAALLMYEGLEAPVHLRHVTVDTSEYKTCADVHCAHTNRSVERPDAVLLHGWGGGGALWYKQVDVLARTHNVFMPDLAGFGLSSRSPPFAGRDGPSAARWFVDGIEGWRKQMGVAEREGMLLVGHSLGAFTAASYALRFPARVSRLVLVAPVGLRRAPHLDDFIESLARAAPQVLHSSRQGRNLLDRITRSTQQAHLTPQSFVRAAGLRLGTLMVSTARARDRLRYGFIDNRVCEYLYHISALPPSGELAWNRLLPPSPRSKWTVPLEDDFARGLNIPVDLVSDPFVDSTFGYTLQQRMERCPQMRVHELRGVGHQVPSEGSARLNAILEEAVEEHLKQRHASSRVQ